MARKADVTIEILRHCLYLWESVYQPKGIVPTVRQYFYACAVAGIVEKSDGGYKVVQPRLSKARERGEFPFEAVYDGLRQLKVPYGFTSFAEYSSTIRRAYVLQKWQFQPRLVEVWVEKDAVRGTIESVCTAYQVPLLVARGYASITAKRDASLRLTGRPATIIYIGDFDPSGVNMIEEAGAWVREQADLELELEVDRIAITTSDRYDPELPKLPVNEKDTRAKDFVRRYSREVVEVEALAPEALQQRLRDASSGTATRRNGRRRWTARRVSSSGCWSSSTRRWRRRHERRRP